MPYKKLGELLVEAGLITEEQLEIALEEIRKQKKKRLGAALVEKGFVTETDIAQTLAFQLGIPYISLDSAVIEPEAVKLVPERIATKYLLIPVSLERPNIVKVAMSDPLNLEALKEIRFITGRECAPIVATTSDVMNAIKKHYHVAEPLEDIVSDIPREKFLQILSEPEEGKDSEEILRKSQAPPVIKMVNSMLVHAIDNRASDLHIEPRSDIVQLRERIDGVMREVMQIPKWLQGPITSRIKIMAKLDISEKRIPQDGRIQVQVAGKKYDLRISTLPTQYGETIVMRILDPEASLLTLDQIGLSLAMKQKIKDIIERPQGIVLVAGPTGSGKTSTLYAMISHLKTPAVNIITLEDPIEYRLEGVNQVPINDRIGLTFAFCLRSVLRQDPDIILVGEMRDEETAQIAFQASVTGHLVLSTVHTTDAISAVTRLRNIGVPSYLIASALNGVVAQRLVRKICNSCKEPYNPSKEELLKLGLKDRITLYRGMGCKQCNDTGYYGRTGVFEIFVVDRQIREMIASDVSEEAIRRVSISNGMITMFTDGIEKVKEGITTVEELERVIAKEKEEGITTCPVCARQLVSGGSFCPTCGTIAVLSCPYCGKDCQPGWFFCPYCGQSLGKSVHISQLSSA